MIDPIATDARRSTGRAAHQGRRSLRGRRVCSLAVMGAGVGGSLLGGTPARADNLTFLGANQDGGSGTWSASPTVLDWLTATDAANGNLQNGVAWNNAGGTTAVFGAGADGSYANPYAITVDAGGVLAAGISFNNSGYAVGGPGTITIAAGGVINSLVSNNTISATLAGTGVTYAGTTATATTTIGSVAVTGANTYTGPTTITGGILSLATIANAGAGGTATTLGTSSNASSNLILNGGQLAYTGGTATTDRGFSIGTSESILNVSQGSTNLTFGGKINSGTAIFDKLGAGVVTFANTGGNAFGNGSSGGLFILNGGLVLAGGTNTIGGTLRVGNNGNNGEFPNVLGPAFLNISGGTTTVSGSMLLAENGGSGNTDTVNLLNGATLVTTSTAHTGNNNNGTLTTGNTFFNVGGGSTYNSGSNVFTLSGSAGTVTTVNLGDGSAAAGTYIGQGLTNGAGTSTLNFNNASIIATAGSTTFITAGSTANVLGGGLTFNTSTYADTIAANMAGGSGAGGLVKLGTGTLTLTGADTYTGGNNVSAGTLDVENGGSITSLTAKGTGTNAFAAGTTLTLGLGGATGFTGDNLTSIIADSTFAGTNTLRLNTAGGSVSSPAAIGGSLALVKVGVNTLTLTGSDTYTGGTNVSAGVLEVGPGSYVALTNNSSGTANTNLVASGAALAFDLGGTTGFSTTQLQAALADTNFSSGSLLGLFATGGNYAYGNTITGSFGVLTGGANTLTLSGSNTYTGGTNVSAGTLMVGNAAALGTGNIVISGGTLDTAGYNVSAALVTITAGSVTDSVGTGSLQGAVYNVSGGTALSLGGTGRFNKIGTTTYAPTVNSTYTGPTNVTAGILSLSAIANGGVPSLIGASSSASGNLIVGAGQLLYTGPSATTDRGFTVAGAGSINVGSGVTLTFNGSSAGAGAGGLTKYGLGTLALNGATTALGGSGAVYVVDGNLAITSAGTSALTTGNFYVGAFNGFVPPSGDALSFATLAGGGTFSIANLEVGNNSIGATTTRVDTLNLTGGTTLNQVGNTGIGFLLPSQATMATGIGVVNISGGSRLVHSGGDFRLGEQNGSTGIINLTDAGSTLLMNSGTLFLGEPGTGIINQAGGTTVAATNGVTFGNGTTPSATTGTYNLGNGSATNALLVIGTSIAKTNAATTSTLNINGGTIQANSSSATLIAAGITTNVLAGGVTFNTGSNSPTVVAGLLGSTTSPGGGLTKNGTGRLTLAGSDTYTGATVVNAGTLAAGSATFLSTATTVTDNNGGTVAFNGLFLQPAGSTSSALTLAGLNVASGGTAAFNLSTAAGGSADEVAIGAAANVAGGALISILQPTGVAPIPGTYTLFTDAAGGLSTFTLATSNFSTGGTVYGYTLAANNTSDVLTVNVLTSLRYFFSGASTNSLASVANYSLSQNGNSPATSAPTGGNDLIFSTTNVNAANTTATLGGLAAVNSLEFNTATAITITGPGTLQLNAANVGLAAGVGIQVDAGAAVPTISAGLLLPQTTAFVNNANASSAGPAMFSGVISGNGSSGLNLTSTAAAGAAGAFNLSGANTFTGPLNVSGGANLVVATINNGATAGPLGMSSNASSNVLLQNGGTLTYTGGTATTDRGITFGAGTGLAVNLLNVSTPSTVLTFASPVASNASGTAVILGSGTVTLAGTSAPNTFGSNGLYVLSGALNLAPGTTTTDTGTFRIGNNGPNSQYSAVPANAVVTLNNASLNVSSGTFFMGNNDGAAHKDTLNVTNGSGLSIATTFDESGGNSGNQGVSTVTVSGGSFFNTSSAVEIGGDSAASNGANGTFTLADTSRATFGSTTYVGYGNTGTVGTANLTGSGNVSIGGTTYLGYFGGQGTINLTGTSTMTVSSTLYLGYYGSGTLNQSGGTILPASSVYVGAFSSTSYGTGTGTGLLNVTGGTFNTPGSMYVGYSGNGTVNQPAGTVGVGGTLYLGYNSGYTGTYNLGSGVGSTATLTASAVQGVSGTSTLNFNGGTLRANSSSTSFLTVGTVNVGAGGATIDTQAFNDTVTSPLAGSGGLAKLGTGTLTLTGADTFAGPTNISAGGLQLGSGGKSLPSGTALTLGTGVTAGFGGGYIQPANTTTPAFNLGSLTLAGNNALTFNAGTGGIDYLGISAAASIGTGAVINLVGNAGQALTPGTYNLLSDANGGLGNFTLGQSTLTTGGSAYSLTLNQTGTYEQVVVGSGTPSHLYFKGGSSNLLSDAANYTTDSAGTTPANTSPVAFSDVVFLAAGGVPANYATTLGTTTAVNSLEFNSTSGVSIAGAGPLTIAANAGAFAAGTGIVVDAGAAAPTISAGLRLNQTTTFSNNTNASSAGPLVLSGVISGNSSSAGLTLSSNNVQTDVSPGGAFNLSGANTFTGPLTIANGASVVVNTIASGGLPSSLGASSNAPSNLTLQTGGTLTYTGGTAVSDRGFTTNGGITAVQYGDSQSPDLFNISNPATTLTLGGQVTGGSAGGNLIVLGGGTLALTNAASTNNLNGTGLYVLAGSVSLGNGSGGVFTGLGDLRVGNEGPFSQFFPVSGNSNLTLNGATVSTSQMLLAENNGAAFAVSVNLLAGSSLLVTGTARTGGTGATQGSGPATINVNGGATYIGSQTLTLSNAASTTTTLNLGNGSAAAGVVTVPSLVDGSGTTVLNFNNGTLRANSSGGTVLPTATGLTVNVLAGGATIDTQANSTTVSAPLLASATSTGGGLTTAGTGTLTLTGASTYAGPTTVSNTGTLRVNGSLLSTGTVLVPAGGTLGGNGSVGAVTVAGTITAGATATTVGNLSTGTQTWNASGSYAPKLITTTSDRLVMSGLTVTATPANPFVINLTGTNASTGTGTYVLAVDQGATAGDPFAVAALILKVNGGAAPSNYSLSEGIDTTSAGGFDLLLSTVAAPEPTSLLLLAAAGAPLALGRRRRRSSPASSAGVLA